MKRFVEWFALNGVLALAWLGSLSLIVSSCGARIRAIPAIEPQGGIKWAAGAGTPVPDDFVVLWAPGDGAMMKSVDDGPDQPLVRAVHASLAEDRVVSLTCDTRKFEVPRESLTLAKPGMETDRLIVGLVSEYRSRPGTTAEFQVRVRSDSAAPDAVALSVRSSDGITTRCTYRITESGPVPLRLESYNHMEEVLAKRPGEGWVWGVHWGLALAATVGLVVLGYKVGRRLR